MIGRLVFLFLIFKILDLMFGWSHSFKQRKEGKQDNDLEQIKNRRGITGLAVALAVPIPLSVLTWIPTIMSLAGEGSFIEFFTSIGSFLFLLMMISSGTYVLTYIFAISKTRKDGKITWISYLPAWQVALTFLLIFLSIVSQSSAF